VLATQGRKAILLWDVLKGTQVGKLDTEDQSMVFSQDGKRVATADLGVTESIIRIWDASTGKVVTKLQGEPVGLNRTYHVNMNYLPHQDMLALSNGHVLTIWDLKTSRVVHRLPMSEWSLVFSPDGKVVAARTQSAIVLIDVATGKKLHQHQAHDEPVECLAVSPDGKMLASAARSVIHTWSYRFGQPKLVIEGHDENIHYLAFSTDGKTLVSSAWD